MEFECPLAAARVHDFEWIKITL